MPLLPKPPMMSTHGYISSTFYSTQNSGNDARSDLFRGMALRNVSNTPTEKNCSLLLLNGYYWHIYIYIIKIVDFQYVFHIRSSISRIMLSQLNHIHTTYMHAHALILLHIVICTQYTEYLPICYIVFISGPPSRRLPQVVRTRFQVSPFAEEMVWEAILNGRLQGEASPFSIALMQIYNLINYWVIYYYT